MWRKATRKYGVALFVAWAASSATSAPARAFSDPISYADPVDLGGGAGRWFTGSPADGFGCDTCHTGAPGAELSVLGLPSEGVVPGASYEVSLIWPGAVQHLALIAEFSDELRQGAGTLALPRPDATAEVERCTGEQLGFPSSEIHEADGGRQLVSVVDCGARMLRFQWMAPAQISGPLWFNAGFVASNDDGAPGGDGVTLVSLPLQLEGTSPGTRTVAQGCSVIARPGKSSSAFTAFVFMVLAVLWGLRASRRQEVQ